MDNLLILGAGQYGQLIKELAQQSGKYEKIEFLDDYNECAIGKLDDYLKYTENFSHAIVSFGDINLRKKWVGIIKQYFVLPIVSYSAYVSPSAKIGSNVVIEPFAVVHSSCNIGDGCLISSGAVINHNSTINSFCNIDCNATVGARSVIEEYSVIKTNDSEVK